MPNNKSLIHQTFNVQVNLQIMQSFRWLVGNNQPNQSSGGLHNLWLRPRVKNFMNKALCVAIGHGMKSNSFWIVSAVKDPLLKLQDTDHTSETPTHRIPHVLNRQRIRQISKSRKNLHVLDRRKFYMRLYNMWACTILLGIPWRKRMTSGGSTPRRYQLVLRLPLIRTKLDHLWYEISPQSLTLGVRPLCLLITHSGIQRWPA